MTDRAFSKKCGKCRQRTVELATVPYTITIDHDGREYVVTIPDLVVPRCGSCGTVVLDEEANRRISAAFRAEAGLLRPEQIRDQRVALGLTQQALADMLGVAVSTLSRWETGRKSSNERWTASSGPSSAFPSCARPLRTTKRFSSQRDRTRRRPIPPWPVTRADHRGAGRVGRGNALSVTQRALLPGSRRSW
jgi:DNA-binding XRE family transcriptional regulator